VLECWLSGQAAGGAAADLLFGAANPSGRLAETLPLRLEDTPAYLNFRGEAGHVRYGEGIFVGYRGYDKLDRQVSYPFGHGLSYTSFDYADLTTNITGSHRDNDLVVAVTRRVTNTGDRRGKEVVQLYVRDPEASVARPVRELKAFAKVDLTPGETTVVEFTLAARDLSYWSTSVNDWALEAGEFELASVPPPATYGSPPRSTSPPLLCRSGWTAWPSSRNGWPIPAAPPCCTRRSEPTTRADPRGSWAAGSSWRSSATSPSAPWPPSPAWGSPTISSTAWSSRSPREMDSDLGATGGSLSQTQGVGPVGLHTTSRGMSLIEATDAEPTRRRRLQKVVS
jgi:hypothetical protein